MKQKKNDKGARVIKKRWLVVALSIIIIALLLIIQAQTNNEKKKPAVLSDVSPILMVEDLYHPHLVTDSQITISLDQNTLFTYWGVSKGSYWIESPSSGYNLSAPDEIDPDGGGQFTIKAGTYPGNYTIHILGSARILLSDRAISDQTWQTKSWEGNISNRITAFDVENVGAMDLTITTMCNSSVYIYDDALTLVDAEYVNHTTETISIKKSYSMLYNVIIVTDPAGVGTSLTASYTKQTSQGETLNFWILIFVGMGLIGAFIYFRYYRGREN